MVEKFPKLWSYHLTYPISKGDVWHDDDPAKIAEEKAKSINTTIWLILLAMACSSAVQEEIARVWKMKNKLAKRRTTPEFNTRHMRPIVQSVKMLGCARTFRNADWKGLNPAGTRTSGARTFKTRTFWDTWISRRTFKTQTLRTFRDAHHVCQIVDLVCPSQGAFTAWKKRSMMMRMRNVPL